MPTKIPATGQIDTADFEAAFGTIPFEPDTGDYYRGGPRVEDIAPNDNIPTSGANDSDNYRNAKNDEPALTNDLQVAAENFGSGAQIATAGFRFTPEGTLWRYDHTGDLEELAWLTDLRLFAGEDWEVKVEEFNGTLTSANAGVWISIASSVSFELEVIDVTNNGVAETASVELEVAIRDRSGVTRASVVGIPSLFTERWNLSVEAERTG
jgi:hypothetical protein